MKGREGEGSFGKERVEGMEGCFGKERVKEEKRNLFILLLPRGH